MKKSIYLIAIILSVSALAISMAPSGETDNFQNQLSDFYSAVTTETDKNKSVNAYIFYKEQEFGKKFNAEQLSVVKSYALMSVEAKYKSANEMVAGYRNMMNFLNPEEPMESCSPQIQSEGWFENLCDFAGYDGNPDGTVAGCTYVCLDWFSMEDCVLSIPCPTS